MQPNDRALYVIKKSPLNKEPQLALHVQLWAGIPAILRFHDTIQEYKILGKVAKIEDDAIHFKATDGGLWTLQELTIEEYRLNVAKHVEHGEILANTIKSTERLWEWYRKQYPL